MNQFSELLSKTTDDTIRRVLGDSAAELIYGFMRKQAYLKRREISEETEVLYAYLQKLLGSEGAQTIQATTLKRLCHRLKREYDEVERHFSFLDKLYETKFKLLASMSRKESSGCN